MTMKKKIYEMVRLAAMAAAILWLTVGCSCERRVERLRRSCPDCFAAQTIHVRDTIVPAPVRFQEYIPWSTLDWHDTLLLEQPQYTLLVVSGDEGLDIQAEVRPDTVYRDVEVPVEVPVVQPRRDTWPWAACIAVGLVALWGIIHSFTRRRR